MNWRYPKEAMTRLQGKMTVSELKKMAGEAMPGQVLYPEKREIPEPSLENPVYIARQRGIAVHKILELLPFDAIHTEDDVRDFIHRCRIREQIPEFWEELIPSGKVFAFCRSGLGQRMARALQAGRLFRERPFVMGIPVKEVYPELEEGEHILVQGLSTSFLKKMTGSCWSIIKQTMYPGERLGRQCLYSVIRPRWIIIREL